MNSFRLTTVITLCIILFSLSIQGCDKDERTAEPQRDMKIAGTWEASANQLTMNLTGPGGEDGTMVYDYAIDGNILKLIWSIPSGTKFYTEFTRQE
jgi:hypothetical protein